MFSGWCPAEGAEVLLTERRILAVDVQRDVVIVQFRCWCGAVGTVGDARPARPARPASRAKALSGAHVAVTPHHELGRGELAQAHGAPGVQLLGADADLGAEAELLTVDEAG